jgi:hypothetical protein
MKVIDLLCGVIISHGVVPTSARDILQVPNLSTIWMVFPCDMTLLMHLTGTKSINLIDRLRDLAHDSTPSSSSPN